MKSPIYVYANRPARRLALVVSHCVGEYPLLLSWPELEGDQLVGNIAVLVIVV